MPHHSHPSRRQALGLLAAGAGSLALSLLGESSMMSLVTAWLGPTLIISALATFLAQIWRPLVTVPATLTAWTAVVLLLALELNGVLKPAVSLESLIRPGAGLQLTQVLMVMILVTASWLSGPGSRLGTAR